MTIFCDVALPVPLDQCFTYRVKDEADPPRVGARVTAPFRSTKLIGIVTRVHNQAPSMEAKRIEAVLDREPILTAELMEFGAWLSQYYLAPLGEVYRGMLPLTAEVRRRTVYRITETGKSILFAAAESGSSRRSRLSPEAQDAEYAVLDYLSNGEAASQTSLRRVTRAGSALLTKMVRKKWLTREAEALSRDARRLSRYAVLIDDARPPRLNENQLTILAEIASAGGAMPVAELRRPGRPATTLGSLAKRGLIRIEERAAAFDYGGAPSAPARVLNREQQAALDSIAAQIDRKRFGVTLLHGITGSGKTAVYLAAMRYAADRGCSSLLLVPEIALTPAMAAQLYSTFGKDAALLHSALSPVERAEQWRRIRRGEARMVVGARSAIFAPVENLGLIIVDEEHDSSYKQAESPRYHGRDAAIVRAKLRQAAVVLGSATPSLESWRNAQTGRYASIEIKHRVNRRPLPMIELVDMRREFQETQRDSLFSRGLVDRTKAALGRGEQAIVLLNRRGYSFAVLCRACGEKLQCENCAIALTYHKAPAAADAPPARPEGQRLKCHYCGYVKTVPKRCPGCESEHLFYLGAGSQQGEERLQELFPEARIGRMDRDSVRSRGDMERLLERLHSGRINLLVGTQMIAKGHDIHGVTFVGVVGADYALGLPDFRAAERVFQLLTQVSGRAGRGDLPGEVLIQTYHPEHYAIQCAAQHDFQGFVRRETEYRKWMHYPPYSALANVLIQSVRLEEAADWAAKLGAWFARGHAKGVRVLGPATAPVSRAKRLYRFHLVLKAEKRQVLAKTLREAIGQAEALGIPQRNLIVDVDAINLM